MVFDDFRNGVHPFEDEQHFPRGFRKSGVFTIEEADLLTIYGHTMQQLAAKELQPLTKLERHFVKVVTRGARPTNFLEITWQKYIANSTGKKSESTMIVGVQ